MREIKFRAWYKPENEYIEWEEMYGLARTENNGLAVHIAIADQCYAMPEEIVLEEFTGLRDKNGEEIYEGDILGTDYGIIGKQRPLVVVWNDDYGRYDVMHPALRGEPASLGNLNPRRWGVIGNIHENPELLNGQS